MSPGVLYGRGPTIVTEGLVETMKLGWGRNSRIVLAMASKRRVEVLPSMCVP